MLVGYLLSGNDNGSHFFDQSDEFLPTCKLCGYVTDFEYMSPRIKLEAIEYDISSTYDNRTIVSDRFRVFCIHNKYSGISFIELPNNHNYYLIKISNVLKFDSEKANLRYHNFCKSCGNYESITPAVPVTLKDVHGPIADGFYVTDVHFASGNEKGPACIIGVTT